MISDREISRIHFFCEAESSGKQKSINRKEIEKIDWKTKCRPELRSGKQKKGRASEEALFVWGKTSRRKSGIVSEKR